MYRAHIAVPCLFHRVTGLDCPGCGITRMLVSVLEGDLRAAFRYNPAAFFLLPCVLLLIAYRAFKFVRTGTRSEGKWEKAAVIFMILVFVVFGVVRNLPFYPYPLP